MATSWLDQSSTSRWSTSFGRLWLAQGEISLERIRIKFKILKIEVWRRKPEGHEDHGKCHKHFQRGLDPVLHTGGFSKITECKQITFSPLSGFHPSVPLPSGQDVPKYLRLEEDEDSVWGDERLHQRGGSRLWTLSDYIKENLNKQKIEYILPGYWPAQGKL